MTMSWYSIGRGPFARSITCMRRQPCWPMSGEVVGDEVELDGGAGEAGELACGGEGGLGVEAVGGVVLDLGGGLGHEALEDLVEDVEEGGAAAKVGLEVDDGAEAVVAGE